MRKYKKKPWNLVCCTCHLLIMSVISYLLFKIWVHTTHWDVSTCHIFHELSLEILLTMWLYSLVGNTHHISIISAIFYHLLENQVHTPHRFVSTCHIFHEVSLEILLIILTSCLYPSYVDNVIFEYMSFDIKHAKIWSNWLYFEY